jgi:hypothetical protein
MGAPNVGSAAARLGQRMSPGGRKAPFAAGESSPSPDDQRQAAPAVSPYVSSPSHTGPSWHGRARAAMTGMRPRL